MKGATAAAVICFVAAIAIVGTYTFSDYKRTQREEQIAKAVEEEDTKDKEKEEPAEEANNLVVKQDEPEETETPEETKTPEPADTADDNTQAPVQSTAGSGISLFSSLPHTFFKVRFIGNDLSVPFLHRQQRIGNRFSHSCLKISVAFSFKFFFNFIKCLFGHGTVNRHKIFDSFLAFPSSYLASAVGDSTLKFTHNSVTVI